MLHGDIVKKLKSMQEQIDDLIQSDTAKISKMRYMEDLIYELTDKVEHLEILNKKNGT